MGSLCRRKLTFLSGEIHRTYLNVRLACRQGGNGQPLPCLVEVSRGHSTASPHATGDGKGRRERASTSSAYLAGLCLSRHKRPSGGQSFAAVRRCQWLGTPLNGHMLTLVLNRLVRIRMPGGVGGARRNPAPIPIVLLRAAKRRQLSYGPNSLWTESSRGHSLTRTAAGT